MNVTELDVVTFSVSIPREVLIPPADKFCRLKLSNRIRKSAILRLILHELTCLIRLPQVIMQLRP